MSSAVPVKPLWKLIDWRLVAACGLPIWAFLIGFAVSHRPARAVPAHPPETPIPQAAAIAEAPMPREIVVREGPTQVITVPIAIPVPADAAEIALPADFRLPASEVLPADRCKSFDTKVRFHPSLADAGDEARKSKKMLFVLHISGDFDDPGFT